MTEIKLSRIGNSRGIRIPSALLKKYAIEDVVLIEESEDSITLRPKRSKKLSWSETAREMASEGNEFRDMDVAVGDGLDEL